SDERKQPDESAAPTVRFGAADAKTDKIVDKPADQAPDAKTVAIPKPTEKPGPQPGDDTKTVALPKVSNPSDAATTVLPIQQPGTDRVVSAGAGPTAKPRPTPRPVPGPKNNPGSQGPSIPTPAPPRPAAAPSPADVKPTVPQAPRPVSPRPIAQPTRVPPAAPPQQPAATDGGSGGGSGNKRWLIAAGAAVVVVIAVIVAVFGLKGGKDNSPQAQVRDAVGSYTSALADGSLSKLRDATCGALHDFYQNIAPDQYAGVHKLAVDQKKIPKIASIDAVQITDQKATAQASVYTEADPTRAVLRTFDLQHTPDGWKV
ncbi:Rv0361 family membrane protein, partial [Nocardia gipuzkoensis]